MGFEHFIAIAQIDTETGIGAGVIGAASGFAIWFGSNVWLPSIKEKRDRREREFNERLRREDEESKARIDEQKQKRLDDNDRSEKSLAAMEARGARETSHMKALEAVADGQKQNLIRLERMEDFQKEIRNVLKAVLRKLDEEHDWEGDDVRPTPTTGQPTPGGTV